MISITGSALYSTNPVPALCLCKKKVSESFSVCLQSNSECKGPRGRPDERLIFVTVQTHPPKSSSRLLRKSIRETWCLQLYVSMCCIIKA